MHLQLLPLECPAHEGLSEICSQMLLFSNRQLGRTFRDLPSC